MTPTTTKALEVQLFAGAKALAGRTTIVVEVSTHPTATEVMDQLGLACEAIVPLLPACRLAVDCKYVGDDFIVPEDCEIALIPPVSGG